MIRSDGRRGGARASRTGRRRADGWRAPPRPTRRSKSEQHRSTQSGPRVPPRPTRRRKSEHRSTQSGRRAPPRPTIGARASTGRRRANGERHHDRRGRGTRARSARHRSKAGRPTAKADEDAAQGKASASQRGGTAGGRQLRQTWTRRKSERPLRRQKQIAGQEYRR